MILSRTYFDSWRYDTILKQLSTSLGKSDFSREYSVSSWSDYRFWFWKKENFNAPEITVICHFTVEKEARQPLERETKGWSWRLSFFSLTPFPTRFFRCWCKNSFFALTTVFWPCWSNFRHHFQLSVAASFLLYFCCWEHKVPIVPVKLILIASIVHPLNRLYAVIPLWTCSHQNNLKPPYETEIISRGDTSVLWNFSVLSKCSETTAKHFHSVYV